MKILYRFLASLCLLAMAVQPARATELQPNTLDPIDAQLRQGQWEAARTAALEEIQKRRKTLFAYYLAAPVARLAVAEAGLGREEDAIWHWHIAQNLDRRALSAEALAAFGKAGELLAHHLLRQEDEPPRGLTVLRAEDPAGEVRPARKLAGDLPTLSADLVRAPAPKGLKLQAVIDAEGRLREPVVVSGGLPGTVWEALEALREWRYQPARRGEQAVAVFRNLTLNPPAEKPLTELASLSGKAAEVEALLRADKWREASQKSRKLWGVEINGDEPARERLAAALALRALAEAGTGETDTAVCRWQAAQHLDERLYDADLSPYGAAGKVLEGNRWGAARTGPVSGKLQQPAVTRGSALPYPVQARRMKVQGVVLLTGIVDERGALHQPAVVRLLSNTFGDMGELESAAVAGPLDSRRLVAISALDSFCDWRFRPATADGKPVAFQQIVAVPFNTASLALHTSPWPYTETRAPDRTEGSTYRPPIVPPL
jgi:hypothetical protein